MSADRDLRVALVPVNWTTLLGIAFGLAMDAFAVAIAVGSRLPQLTFRHFFRLSFHFGLFQFLMPIIGWFAGSELEKLLRHYDHWIAFGLLVYIGGRMIIESTKREAHSENLSDPTRKWSLVMLSVATSIDALAVGVSIALLRVEILMPSVIIGIVAALMTALGMLSGRKLGASFGRRMELLGGVILIAIGLKIVIGHLH